MKQISLSDNEWKLMGRLWERSPRTITELTADLREETGWSKNTIITMLSRLEAKGAVRHEEGVRAKAYYPAVDRETAARAETESFLGKVYGGSLRSAVRGGARGGGGVQLAGEPCGLRPAPGPRPGGGGPGGEPDPARPGGGDRRQLRLPGAVFRRGDRHPLRPAADGV